MAMPMVGRATALDELRRAWARVRDRPAPITAVVTGAAGTGKSALVAAVLRAAERREVLAGTARVHSPAPYDWLAAVLAGRDTSGIDVPPDALAWLKQDPDVPRERYTPDALLRHRGARPSVRWSAVLRPYSWSRIFMLLTRPA